MSVMINIDQKFLRGFFKINFTILKNILVSTIVVFLHIPSTFASELHAIDKKLSKHQEVRHSDLLYPSDVVSENRYRKNYLESSDYQKARMLYEKNVDYNLSGSRLTVSDFEHIVRFVKAYRSKKKPFWKSKKKSRYIHPDRNLLPVPVQLLSNGHVYIHFKTLDPKRKSGGYKTFSRSLDFDTGDLWAHLVVRVRRPKDANSTLAELHIMNDLAKSSLALSYRDVSLYAGHFSGEGDHSGYGWKINFVVPLFDHDLGIYFQNRPELAYRVWLTLIAAQSLLDVHQENYIHRDVKPGNFFVDGYMIGQRFAIADFGLTESRYDPEFGHSLSGTRGYMAPEICERRLSKDHPMGSFQDGIDADNFSLGMTFYSLLKGRGSRVRYLITTMNTIALPKDKSIPPDRNLFDQTLEAYKNTYNKIKPERIRNFSIQDRAMYQYELALWKLLNPDQDSRLTLEEFITELTDILEDLNIPVAA